MVHPDVVQIFGEGKTSRIRKLNRELGLEIELIKDENLPLDQFKVFDLEQKAEVTDMFKSKK
jgi:hypothetical protein